METKQLIEVLPPLAIKLGVTVEYLWGVLVTAGYYQLAKQAVLLVASLIGVVVFAWKSARSEYEDDETGHLVMSVLCAMAAVGIFCLMVPPERYAIEVILGR